jgi:hypothetical protein
VKPLDSRKTSDLPGKAEIPVSKQVVVKSSEIPVKRDVVNPVPVSIKQELVATSVRKDVVKQEVTRHAEVPVNETAPVGNSLDSESEGKDSLDLVEDSDDSMKVEQEVSSDEAIESSDDPVEVIFDEKETEEAKPPGTESGSTINSMIRSEDEDIVEIVEGSDFDD